MLKKTAAALFSSVILITICVTDVYADYSPWTDWSFCSMTCAGGTQTRFKDCINPDMCSLGHRIPDERGCNNIPCPMHGQWEAWESWIACTKLCGGGITRRKRSCDAPSPAFGGRFCLGGNISSIDIESVQWEEKPCNIQPCPVNGGFTDWTEWAPCPATCRGSVTARSRTCTNPATAHGGEDCIGELTQEKLCNSHIMCPVDGGWGVWSTWSQCSSTCTGGEKERIKTCTNPFPLFGGKNCVGAELDRAPCNTDIACPVNGAWAVWGVWSACSSTCSGGNSTRTRTCTNPAPLHGGLTCPEGGDTESQPCNSNIPCPVNGGLSQWSVWGVCTVKCGGGEQTRSRTCTEPAPSHGGTSCTGFLHESQACNIQACSTPTAGAAASAAASAPSAASAAAAPAV